MSKLQMQANKYFKELKAFLLIYFNRKTENTWLFLFLAWFFTSCFLGFTWFGFFLFLTVSCIYVIFENRKAKYKNKKQMIYDIFRLCDEYIYVDDFKDFRTKFSRILKRNGLDLEEIYYDSDSPYRKKK